MDSRFIRKLNVYSSKAGGFPAEIRILDEFLAAYASGHADRRGDTAYQFNQAQLRDRTIMDGAQISRCIKALIEKGDVTAVKATGSGAHACYQITSQGRSRLFYANDTLEREVQDVVKLMPIWEQMELALSANEIQSPTSNLEDAGVRYRELKPGGVGDLIGAFAFAHHGAHGPALQLWAEGFLIARLSKVFAAHERSKAIVMFAGRRVQGFVIVTPWDEKTAAIQHIWVATSFSGKGHGSKLLKRALHFAKEVGFSSAVAFLTRSDTRHSFYDQPGWKFTGVEDVRQFGRATKVERWERSI